MKILFDQNLPWGLRAPLSHHDLVLALTMGWAEKHNGELLALAEEAGFDLFPAGDRNIRYQQNLSKRRIAIVELTTMQWPAVRPHFKAIVEAVDAAVPGSYSVVECRPVGAARDKSRKKVL